MNQLNQIKEAELRHGKMMIGYFGRAKAVEIVGASYPIRKINAMDHQISLDALIDANEKLQEHILKGSKSKKPIYLLERQEGLSWHNLEKYYGRDSIIHHCNNDINQIMDSIALYVKGNLSNYKKAYLERIECLKQHGNVYGK